MSPAAEPGRTASGRRVVIADNVTRAARAARLGAQHVLEGELRSLRAAVDAAPRRG